MERWQRWSIAPDLKSDVDEICYRGFESYSLRHNAELAQLAEQPICGDSLQLLREIVIAYDAKTRKADQVMLKSISC